MSKPKKPLQDYWYPRYPSRYKSKTMHLCPYQDGLYGRLIDHYMETKKALPDSDQALSRICGISLENFSPHSAIIRAFFDAEDGLLFNETCEETLNGQNAGGYARKKRASKAANAMWEKKRKNQGVNAKGYAKSMLGDAIEQKIIEEKKEDVDDATRARGEKTIFEMGEEIAEIVGWKDDPRWFGNYSRIEPWLAAGCDFKLDILPTVKRVMASKKGDPPKSLKYFEAAIADAYATRTTKMSEGTPTNEITIGSNGHGAGRYPKPKNKHERLQDALRKSGLELGYLEG